MLLYESTGSATRRVKFGEEPSRTVVGDLNAQVRFNPRWMTRLVDALPFTNASQPSQTQVQGEIAMSQPNPNTRQTAYVDDLEGADESDEFNLSRTTWALASIPIDTPSREDPELRVPAVYYNPVGRVKRGYLNPKLNSREVNDGITVLELGFDRQRLDSLAVRPDAKYLWSGIMRIVRHRGARSQPHQEHRVLAQRRGAQPARAARQATPRLRRSERGFRLPRHRFRGQSAFQPRGALGGGVEGRPRPRVGPGRCQVSHRRAAAQPRGLGVADSLSARSATTPRRPIRPPSISSPTAARDNKVYDTEDLNNNGIFDERNSYFSIDLDLADPTWVITDVAPLYATDNDPQVKRCGPVSPAGASTASTWNGCISEILKDPTGASPNLRKISYLRIWFEDDAPDTSLFRTNLQLYELRFTRNQWVDLGIFADRWTASGSPAAGESFTVGTINNKDDSAIYELPPDAMELDAQGVQAREQSLRIELHELAARARGGGGTAAGGHRDAGWTSPSTPGSPTSCTTRADGRAVDTAEFFFRVGTDTLNFYEIRR